MPVYNKLVRDKILEIIEAEGLDYSSKILEPQELLCEVKKKMTEEAKELQDAVNDQESIEELADILELVYAATNLFGITFEDLEKVRKEKKEKRGGFDKAIYLIDVEDKCDFTMNASKFVQQGITF